MSFKKSKPVITTIFVMSCIMFTAAYAFPQDEIEEEIKRLKAEIQQKGYSFTAGRTSVSHVPIEKLCGSKVPKNWHEKGKFDKARAKIKTALPSHFDWRDHGCVTTIKSQSRSCAVCWAFATIGSYESAICVNGGPLLDLSEQYLIDCNKQQYNCSSEGWVDFNDLTEGVPLESCYPFECPQRKCQDKPCKSGCPMHYPMADWYYVGYSTEVPGADSLKTAIYTHGPVAAGVVVNSAFKHYTGGIFDKCEDGFSTNHGIVLVGWNDDGGYWILKNSWGTKWGEQGYMRIRYNCSNVGYAAAYAIPMAAD